ncbi:BtrH N-terminal domain-containing protein [Anaerosporobacter faecicola]|uniref:BtrH N-terminal domain-containing protein n=1 Tax=Anaerosporobacter faecicola TaxID=2718714 RepID=UPI00143905F7|nr:BtrH N-terminal domain-containing protein [Anaerosporobacter faecicola]
MKIIEKIYPFNDFFYRDCYYNSLFAVINHFKGDISYILANELQIYDYVAKSVLSTGIVTLSMMPTNKLLEKMNIYYDAKEGKIEPCEIYDALENDKPVILMVDCFEESIRQDYYHKEHLDHNLLIYGYNDEQKTFHIFEHSRTNRLDYKKTIIPVESAIHASNAYIRYFHENNKRGATLITFYQKQLQVNRNKNPFTLFCENYLKHEESIRGQVKLLDQMKDVLCRLISDRRALSNDINVVNEEITEIINAKTIEKKKLKLFLDHLEVNQLIDNILKGWIAIRLYLMNYQYGGTDIEKKLSEAEGRLNEIVLDEKRLIELVFSVINEKMKRVGRLNE